MGAVCSPLTTALFKEIRNEKGRTETHTWLRPKTSSVLLAGNYLEPRTRPVRLADNLVVHISSKESVKRADGGNEENRSAPAGL